MSARLVGCLFALATLAATDDAAAQADAYTGDRWSVGARYGIVVTDKDWHNDGEVYNLTVGRTFGPKYAFEVELLQDELDFGIDYGLKHRGIAFNHMTINREPLWNPYFLIGAGYIEFDAPPGVAQRRDGDFMFNLAVGGQWELVVPNRVFLRADFRVRYDLNDTRQPGQNGFGDGVFTLGIEVPLGR